MTRVPVAAVATTGQSEVPPNPFTTSAARTYLFLAGAALLVVACVFFFRGGLIAAILPVVIALAGLILRWTAMPIFFLASVCYFAIFPFGMPQGGSGYSDIPGSHFRVLDIALTGGVVVYFAAQFRLLSITHRSMPLDIPKFLRKRTDTGLRRPSSNVNPDEPIPLLIAAGIITILAQIAWLAVNHFTVRFGETFPLGLTDFSQTRWRSETETINRFLLFVGIFGGTALSLGLVFWYWRLVRMSENEARMLLLDTGWRESRRESNRQEKWRAWALARRQPKSDLPPPPPKPRPEPRKPVKRRSLLSAIAMTGCLLVVAIFIAIIAVFVIAWFISRR